MNEVATVEDLFPPRSVANSPDVFHCFFFFFLSWPPFKICLFLLCFGSEFPQSFHRPRTCAVHGEGKKMMMAEE